MVLYSFSRGKVFSFLARCCCSGKKKNAEVYIMQNTMVGRGGFFLQFFLFIMFLYLSKKGDNSLKTPL